MKKRSARSLAAEAGFRARVAELGGEVLEADWLGVGKQHRVRCREGHLGAPRPGSVLRGQGICRTCAGRDPNAAWAAFRARVEELGGQVLEAEWLGNHKPHRVRCAKGHSPSPYPSSVQQGQGLCRVCAGNDPKSAWEAFRSRVEELGGRVVETAWLGNDKPHRVQCAEGHESTPRPTVVQRGLGICRVCTRQDPKTAEAAFRARVEELGGTVLEPKWLGGMTRHRIRCSAGHETSPLPNSVQQGRGICRVCSGRDSRAAWDNFRARVEELGGAVLEPDWLGAQTPHRVRCKAGHLTTPQPASVQNGQGICRTCGGRGDAWDAFYVVHNPQTAVVKFGVTSGDSRKRLAAHRRNGFVDVVRCFEGLGGTTAPDLERNLKVLMRRSGISAVAGREYFPDCAMGAILDMVDEWISQHS